MELKIVCIHFQRPLSMLRHARYKLNLHCIANSDTVRCKLFIRGLFEAFPFSTRNKCERSAMFIHFALRWSYATHGLLSECLCARNGCIFVSSLRENERLWSGQSSTTNASRIQNYWVQALVFNVENTFSFWGI